MDSVKVDADGRIAKGQSWFEKYEQQNPQLFNPGRDAYINAYHQTQRDMSAMYNQGYRQTETRNWGQTLSSALNMVPVVGGFKMWTEMNTGKDAVTGEWHHRSDLESFIGAGLNFAGSATMMSGMMNTAARQTALRSAAFSGSYANWEARSIAAWKAAPNSLRSIESGVPAAESGAARQTFATGKEWYDYFAGKHGSQNVNWVSGSGRTVPWPRELPMPATTEMLRVAPGTRSSAFVSQLESVAGPRPTGAIAHHTQPLGLNGVDNGLINGSWVQGAAHQAGHSSVNSVVNSVPYGTWIIIH